MSMMSMLGCVTGRRTVSALVCVFLLGAGAPALAQGVFPSKPLRVIVPFPPGGSADTATRIIANDLSKEIGQSVVVDNRAGAGGIIGVSEGARAVPDGYTIVLVANSYATNFTLRNDLPYKASDLTPVALLGIQPSLLVVKPALKVRSIDELKKLSNQRPLNYASYGAGTVPHMAMETFKRETGLNATHIPYRGEALGLQDLLGGTVDVMFGTLSIMMPYVEQGRLDALAVGSARRSVTATSFPTVRELLNLERFNFESWFGLMAPAATPEEHVTVLTKAIKRVLAQPNVKEALLQRGVEPVGEEVDFKGFLDAKIKEEAETIQMVGIKLD